MKAKTPKKLTEVAFCITYYGLPWLAVGDWNMNPDDLPKKWLTKMGAVVKTAPGLVGTVLKGPMNTYDYIICAIEMESLIEVHPDLESPARVHHSLIISVNRRPRRPREFPIQENVAQLKKENMTRGWLRNASNWKPR